MPDREFCQRAVSQATDSRRVAERVTWDQYEHELDDRLFEVHPGLSWVEMESAAIELDDNLEAFATTVATHASFDEHDEGCQRGVGPSGNGRQRAQGGRFDETASEVNEERGWFCSATSGP